MARQVFYIDGSDASATDPNNVWTNDANGFDGSLTTEATCSTGGSTASNYLMAEGTNAPSSGDDITSVSARIYSDGDTTTGTTSAAIYTDGLGELLGTATNTTSSNSWGAYTLLSTPTGGWTWAKVQALETKVYISSFDASAQIMRVEISVEYDRAIVTSIRSLVVGDGMSTSERVK